MVTRSVSVGPRRSRYVPRSRVGLPKDLTHTWTSVSVRLVKECSYARQSVVYVVENKCFPPSGDDSYGSNLFLLEVDYTAGCALLGITGIPKLASERCGSRGAIDRERRRPRRQRARVDCVCCRQRRRRLAIRFRNICS